MSNSPRPKLTREQIETFVSERFTGLPFTAKEFAKHYCPHNDSFEVARDIDRYGSSLNRDDLEDVERVMGDVEDYQLKIEKEWAASITPPHPIRAVLNIGVIHGVSDHRPATYLVKRHGCTSKGTFSLIKFEDAKLQEVAK